MRSQPLGMDPRRPSTPTQELKHFLLGSTGSAWGISKAKSMFREDHYDRNVRLVDLGRSYGEIRLEVLAVVAIIQRRDDG